MALITLLGPLMVLGITVSALVLMAAPQAGRQLLANLAKAIGLFLAGALLFEIACSALHC